MQDSEKLKFLIEKLEQVLPKIIKDLGHEGRGNVTRNHVDVDLGNLNMALIQLDTILGFVNRLKILPEKSGALSPADAEWARDVAERYATEVANGTLEMTKITKTCPKHGEVTMDTDLDDID